MTVCAVLASLIPILWASGIGADVMKPIAAPIIWSPILSRANLEEPSRTGRIVRAARDNFFFNFNNIFEPPTSTIL